MRTVDERVGGLPEIIEAAMEAVGYDMRVAVPGIVQELVSSWPNG